MKNGDIYKDIKGNTYYVVGVANDVVKYYINLTKESNKYYQLKQTKIENFKKIIEEI